MLGMKKMKVHKAKKVAAKKHYTRHAQPTWYGVDVHHIGLGVATIGTLVVYLLLAQLQ